MRLFDSCWDSAQMQGNRNHYWMTHVIPVYNERFSPHQTAREGHSILQDISWFLPKYKASDVFAPVSGKSSEGFCIFTGVFCNCCEPLVLNVSWDLGASLLLFVVVLQGLLRRSCGSPCCSWYNSTRIVWGDPQVEERNRPQSMWTSFLDSKGFFFICILYSLRKTYVFFLASHVHAQHFPPIGWFQLCSHVKCAGNKCFFWAWVFLCEFFWEFISKNQFFFCLQSHLVNYFPPPNEWCFALICSPYLTFIRDWFSYLVRYNKGFCVLLLQVGLLGGASIPCVLLCSKVCCWHRVRFECIIAVYHSPTVTPNCTSPQDLDHCTVVRGGGKLFGCPNTFLAGSRMIVVDFFFDGGEVWTNRVFFQVLVLSPFSSIASRENWNSWQFPPPPAVVLKVGSKGRKLFIKCKGIKYVQKKKMATQQSKISVEQERVFISLLFNRIYIPWFVFFSSFYISPKMVDYKKRFRPFPHTIYQKIMLTNYNQLKCFNLMASVIL